MARLSEFLEVEQVCAQLTRAGHSSVAVCAANSGEGVTTVSMALAEHCRNADKKTLLVDCNYYRPSLHRHYSLQRSEWRLGESANSATEQVSDGLYVLPASLTLDEQLRQPEQLKQQLSAWQYEYQAIVLDTSPLNAINRHNLPAEYLSGFCNASIMVLRSAVTKEADILEALAKLKSHEAHLSGWVMNDIECPTLASEMNRELVKLRRYAPRLTRWLERKIQQYDLVNQVM